MDKRSGNNGAMYIKGNRKYVGNSLQDAQDSITDSLFGNRPLAKLFPDKTRDTLLVKKSYLSRKGYS